ncbi:thioredoxin family protein [Phytohabitans houttuyneae]|uniref:Thioredoxin family protein n=1 Tax=Phytohabitans houttuyneae TaxID=1076126 RepID=A0A6V8KRZ5_9ACTN|nr:thioredoxin family protein [Phytohabitans houttuyneae]GFJ84567.1 thioredoxin family protein [Phytohabitans houttuyneae]
MAVSSFLVPLGTPAPDFALPSVDGREVKLADVSAPALLVVFLSNHCPYVRHVESALGAFAAEYVGKGLATIGISSNDVVNYPDDDVPGLAGQVERAGFTFPYLVDSAQDVAKAYSAACTPDFFLYDGQRRLVYRGAFDEARPKNDVPVTGNLLRAAADAVLRGESVPEPHVPSSGCGIKWRPGNEPPPISFL